MGFATYLEPKTDIAKSSIAARAGEDAVWLYIEQRTGRCRSGAQRFCGSVFAEKSTASEARSLSNGLMQWLTLLVTRALTDMNTRPQAARPIHCARRARGTVRRPGRGMNPMCARARTDARSHTRAPAAGPGLRLTTRAHTPRVPDKYACATAWPAGV